jgi:hypothetical protein
VRLVLANKSLTLLGGSEAYLITVGEQLQRLGHEVVAYSPELGEAADSARDRGLRVASAHRDLPDEVDGLLAQDSVTAYELAEMFPAAVRVYVAHSIHWDQHSPPQLPDVSHAVVTLSDSIRRRCEALAHCPPVARLRQPVNLRRFRPGTRRERPRRVLALGNYWAGPRYENLSRTCADIGLELAHAGLYGRPTSTPELEIAEADIVVGVGRCILEAMAGGRAAYVYGVAGGDGWITPESYEAMEADGFTGRATDSVVDAARLRADLLHFDAAMGDANRDLAFRHHDVGSHALELVELFRSVEPRPVPGGLPLAEFARLVRLQWEAEIRASRFAWRARDIALERDRLAEELGRVREQWQAEYERAASRVRELHDAYNRLLATRRWRIAQLIAKPLDLIRGLRDRIRARRA